LGEQFAEDPAEGEGTTRRFASMPTWWLGWKARPRLSDANQRVSAATHAPAPAVSRKPP